MSETELTDAQALALAGTTDSDTDFEYHTVGQSTYYLDGFRQRHRLLTILKAVNALRVFKDGALTFGVRGGKFMNGDSAVAYAGASAQALTNNETNYIYLTAAGTLTVNITGFPNPSTTPHVPLATILTASGAYAWSDITDYRDRALFAALSAMTGANANTLTGGSNADALHIHAAAGLAAELQDVIPNLILTGADDGDGTGWMTIQVRDAANNDLAERFRVRAWIADAEYSEPDAQTDFSVSTGEELREIEADADYEAISDVWGTVVMHIDTAGDKTVYVMAEIDGRIYTGSVAITGN